MSATTADEVEALPVAPRGWLRRSRSTHVTMLKLISQLGGVLMLTMAWAGTDPAPGASVTNRPTVLIQLGDNFYQPEELAAIVRKDAKRRRIDFAFESAQCGVIVRTTGSNDVVRVSYSNGLGKLCYQAFIGVNGQVTTDYLDIMRCGYGDKHR